EAATEKQVKGSVSALGLMNTWSVVSYQWAGQEGRPDRLPQWEYSDYFSWLTERISKMPGVLGAMMCRLAFFSLSTPIFTSRCSSNLRTAALTPSTVESVRVSPM